MLACRFCGQPHADSFDAAVHRRLWHGEDGLSGLIDTRQIHGSPRNRLNAKALYAAIAAGKSILELAEVHHVTHTAIRYALKRAGLEHRQRNIRAAAGA